MGFKVAWVAVKGKPADAVLAEIGLARTGEFVEDDGDMEFGLVTMPSGWIIVLNNFGLGGFLLGFPLDAVKVGAEVLTCYVYENTGMSMLCAYRDAQEVWTVTHDVEKGLGHLEVDGDPPAPFARMRAEADASRTESDREAWEPFDYHFGIAIDLGEALTGFHYAKSVEGLGPTPYEVLEPARVVAAGPAVTR